LTSRLHPSRNASCGYSRLINLINSLVRIAEYNCNDNLGLPPKDIIISRCCHVEDYEPDTHKCYQSRGYILSRICRYIFSIATFGFRNLCSRQKAKHYSSIGGSKYEQAAKTTRTLNRTNSQLRDLTASTDINLSVMRRRSFHSSACILEASTKGNSDIISVSSPNDNNIKKLSDKTKSIKTVKSYNVTTLASQKLAQLNKFNQKYYKILDIISDPYFLVACYEEIKGKKGNMTPGSDGFTLDGLDWIWFLKVSDSIRKGTFSFIPSRRIEIPKANGQTRPLGIGSPREKIVQKALHAVLEAIFEPLFLNYSHGFRPSRSIHSALVRIYLTGNKHSWVIQGDISKCFDSIPHSDIMKNVSKKIGDPRVLELLAKFLNAGYVDPNTGQIVNSEVGTPQGGILSPLLCNIVLHQFDSYMDKMIHNFNKGTKRRDSSEYQKLAYYRRKATSVEERRELLNNMRSLSSNDQMDPNFKRLDFIRYADDFVVMVTGSKNESIYIKKNIMEYLKQNCGLQLNDDKTLVTRIADNNWKFLGAEILKLKKNPSFLSTGKSGKMVAFRRLLVKAPIDSLLEKLVKTGFVRRNHKGTYLPKLYGPIANLEHADILNFYNSKARGILNFYSFASNRNKLGRILWYLKASCALTLARKFKLGTMRKAFKTFGKNLKCPNTDLEFFNHGSLKVLHDYKMKKIATDPMKTLEQSWSSKLTKSSFGKNCAICGSMNSIEMHHVRSVKDVRSHFISKETFDFKKITGAVNRKQVPLCQYHHQLFHQGELSHQDIITLFKYNG